MIFQHDHISQTWFVHNYWPWPVSAKLVWFMIIDYAATSPGFIVPWLMTMTCIDQNWLAHDIWHWQVQAQPVWSMLILNDNHWSKTASLRSWACAYWVIKFSDIPELLAPSPRMAPAILCQRRVLTVLVPAWAPPTTGKCLDPIWSLQMERKYKVKFKELPNRVFR